MVVLAENKAKLSASARLSNIHTYIQQRQGHGHIHIHVYICAFMLARFSAEFVLHLYRKLV